jgi:hypothetical protein
MERGTDGVDRRSFLAPRAAGPRDLPMSPSRPGGRQQAAQRYI